MRYVSGLTGGENRLASLTGSTHPTDLTGVIKRAERTNNERELCANMVRQKRGPGIDNVVLRSSKSVLRQSADGEVVIPYAVAAATHTRMIFKFSIIGH